MVTQQNRRPLIIAGSVVAGIAILCGIGFVAVAASGGFKTPPRLTMPTTAPTSAEPDTVLPPAPPVKITMPDGLVGQNALIVHDQLRDLGFSNINYASADKGDSIVILPQNWKVTKVEPGAGSQLSAEATIVVTCTKAQT